jgi:endonuclease/exonuclease/phosphatase family metal-dependent hydrolase
VAVTELDARHRRALPTIIAGDLDAAPEAASTASSAGCSHWAGRASSTTTRGRWPATGPGHTWTSDNPRARAVMDQIVRQPAHRRRLDYVFIGSAYAHPLAHCHVRAARLAYNHPAGTTWASDHFGVVLDAEIANDA